MSAFSTVPKIYYWPLIGRSGSLIRMLDYMGEKYEFFSEFGEIAAIATAFGADSDTFAPPFLVDGDFTISQSNAATMYLGDKLGLNEGADVGCGAVAWPPPHKQHMSFDEKSSSSMLPQSEGNSS